jgi:hypothetical protein
MRCDHYITRDPTRTLTAGGRVRIARYGDYEFADSFPGPIIGEALGFVSCTHAAL